MRSDEEFEQAKILVNDLLSKIEITESVLAVLFGACIVTSYRDGISREKLHHWVDSCIDLNCSDKPEDLIDVESALRDTAKEIDERFGGDCPNYEGVMEVLKRRLEPLL